MITREGLFDWAVQDPGPPDRTYSDTNKLLAYIPHDMVGYYKGPHSYTAMRDANRTASWGGSIGFDTNGRPTLWQHYDVFTSTWTSNNWYYDTRAFTTETVRTEYPIRYTDPEPMPDDLVAIHLRILEDLEAFTGRSFIREPNAKEKLVIHQGYILEHREVALRGTTCPNGRMAPIYAALEDDMTPEEVREIVRTEIAQALIAFDEVDDDDRLRAVLAKRHWLIALAHDADAVRVERAVKLLQEANV